MIYYRTTLAATHDGKRTFGIAYTRIGERWFIIGETRRFRTYSQSVRARDEARRIAFKHALQGGHDPRTVAIVEE